MNQSESKLKSSTPEDPVPAVNVFRRCPWTIGLLVVYLIVFVGKLVAVDVYHQGEFVLNYLTLSRWGMAHHYYWQLLTYQFLHGGWLHLFFNGWVIFIFGRELEQLIGWRRLLSVMLFSGIVGGVFQVLTAILWPGLFDGPVVGASACAFGLVATFAVIFPEDEFTLLILFLIRVRVRAQTLLALFIVIAVMGIIFPVNHLANAAHLGGMAMGWLYGKGVLRQRALSGLAEHEYGAAGSIAAARESEPGDARKSV